ncbi:hypothetical protein PP405_11405 [Mycobacteroides abscessus]|nr:hypothetical protein [Mycobacteroides abscessus]MDM2133377.1 hypothetical protein [Mycobacteroides abscessus]MDM2145068.1 hypothetical protein [Mycobacteroides abscessus]MDM2153161.1 hypothetical protein [Mycobacteroides abscessus]MDM2170284.1 hypothetical protein [Mycobacteroides abscessus]
MPEPTRALLEMVAELADRLQDITVLIEPASPTYCSGRAWSPIGLREYVVKWTAEFDERDARKQALTDTLANLPADAHPDYAAAVILHHFDVKPKAGA